MNFKHMLVWAALQHFQVALAVLQLVLGKSNASLAINVFAGEVGSHCSNISWHI